MATSAWSTEAWTDTVSGSSEDVFIDNFDSQPIGVTVGSGLNPPIGDPNAAWWYTGVDNGETCTVEDGPNGKALHFGFVPTAADGRCEAGIKLGSVYQQISLGFKLYIPDGTESYGGAAYKHRYLGSAGTNCKVFRLWNTDYNGPHKLGASLWRVDDDTSQISLDFMLKSGGMWSHDTARYTLITAASRGTWLQIRFDMEFCNASRPGKITLFVDGTQRASASVDQYVDGEPSGGLVGYLLGAFNTGFDEETILVLDDLRVTT